MVQEPDDTDLSTKTHLAEKHLIDFIFSERIAYVITKGWSAKTTKDKTVSMCRNFEVFSLKRQTKSVFRQVPQRLHFLLFRIVIVECS